MGSLGPFARPTTRRWREVSFLCTARGTGGQTIALALALGTPVLVQTAAAIGEGVGQGLAVPQGVSLPHAIGEGAGVGLAVPHAVFSPHATGQGSGLGLVVPHAVFLPSALGQGAGVGLVVPQGVANAAAVGEGAWAGSVTPEEVSEASAIGEGTGLGLVVPAAVSGASAVGQGAGEARVSTLRRKKTLFEALDPRIATLRATLTAAIGDRPYRLYLVTATHHGGEAGRGSVSRTRREIGCGEDKKTGEIMPPKIDQGRAQSYATGPRGLSPTSGSSDTIYVSQISPTLIERDFVNFVDLASDQESYFELEHVGKAGGVGAERPIRRYRLAKAPVRDTPGMQWTLALVPVEPSKTFGGPRLG